MYKLAPDLEKIANNVIDFEMNDSFEKLNSLKIAYLWSDKQKKKGSNIVFADCQKVNDKMHAISGIDFIITFYADAEDIPEPKKYILMEHELMHIGIDEEGHKSIIHHDLEEFKEIVEKYGTDWIKE